jgi:hypothetical protein
VESVKTTEGDSASDAKARSPGVAKPVNQNPDHSEGFVMSRDIGDSSASGHR